MYYDQVSDTLRRKVDILSMNPIITHMIKSLNDYHYIVEPLNPDQKSCVFFPIHGVIHVENE